MVHVLDWLLEQRLRNAPAYSMEERARNLLLTLEFYASMSSLRSLFKLSKAVRGNPADPESLASFVRRLLVDECVLRRSLNGSEKTTPELAIRCGEVVDDEGWIKLPSLLHRQFLLRKVYCRHDSTSDKIFLEGLSKFVLRVIERLDPSRLRLSASQSAADNRVYKRQYQNEFYRAACTVLPITAVLSPNVGCLFGAQGYLDYLLSPHGWGFELMGDGAKLKKHIERFGPGGVYNKLLGDEVIKDYVILDLRVKPLSKPSQCSHTVHVVFNNDFETATLHTFGREPKTLHVRGGA